ncbi:GNAT family N-acetyltransferase [Arthrobacter sp. JSM 101049]|uniref:GNAT family N-acetyltransferase n=1 Tax=Arthrobacter sp. JSM 101049 TaxID=929097 RepID=UPI003566C2EC
MIPAIELSAGIQLRTLEQQDAERLAAAHRLNREYLSPWEPHRAPAFYTADGQVEAIKRQVRDREIGRSLPLVLATTDEIIGQTTLSGITHGAFDSAALGYWIDERYQGRGLMTSALSALVELSRSVLGLHRLEAQTLPGNAASRHLLGKLGFERIGYAPRYLRIAGDWQDHVLYQLILRD